VHPLWDEEVSGWDQCGNAKPHEAHTFRTILPEGEYFLTCEGIDLEVVDTIESKRGLFEVEGFIKERTTTLHLWNDGSVTWTSNDRQVMTHEL
jgi:hypothetical protein